MSNGKTTDVKANVCLEQLRDILLREESTALQKLQHTIDDRNLLAGYVNPIIEDHIAFLKEHFPLEYAQVVNTMIEQKIKSSKQEIINTISPMLGKKIQKYISYQFQI